VLIFCGLYSGLLYKQSYGSLRWSSQTQTHPFKDNLIIMVQSSASPTSGIGPSYDATPHIGTIFEHIQLSSILSDDEKIKELAQLVSHRGVVFFTEAQDLTLDQQKFLGQRMGELTGKPATSTLHRHPISEETSELGAETSVISSQGGIARQGYVVNRIASSGWHTDITFEPVPSDYAVCLPCLVYHPASNQLCRS
jgi:alpha-ketoglutarate-dependent taurine dioxygenase